MSELRTTVYQYFQTDDIPTEEQFQFTWNSVWFKDEKFSITDVNGLDKALQNKLGTNHQTDAQAHSTVLAKLDASNLNYDNIQLWKTALGVNEIPANVALVDEGFSQGVYNKEQIEAITMLLSEFTSNSGKILADKIEALGLTDLIEVTENTLADFIVNSGNYEFQKNDFIAIPDADGNYALFMFKGGDATNVNSYLPTGLTSITIEMVQGLQAALAEKVDMPTEDGDFILNRQNGETTYKGINPAANYLLFWTNSKELASSNLYRNPDNGRIGIGTTQPSEQLQLMGRARMSAIVLDENTEALPGQITRSGDRFSGTNPSGVKRPLQYADYNDWYLAASNFTQAQALAIANLLGGGQGSPGNPSVNLISPPIVQNQYDSVEYVMLQGANLNLGLNRKVEILAADKTTVIVEIPDNQIQTYDSGLNLVFFYNFYQFAEGQYFIRLTSGAKVFTTSLDLNIVQSVQNIDLSTITWEKLYDQNTTPNPSDIAQGANLTATTAGNNTGSSIPVLSFKSSEIFAQGEDFYIEVAISLPALPSSFDNRSYLGLGYNSTANVLAPSSLVFTSWRTEYFNHFNVINNNDLPLPSVATPYNYIVIFIKTGNLFRTIIGNSNTSKTLSNNSGYSLFFQLVARTQDYTVQAQITKAFKFN